MTIDITDVATRISYTVTTADDTFVVPFNFFANTDLAVYNDTTLLTYASSPSDATEYSVTGASVEGGGTIVLGGTVTSTTITIVRDVPATRTTSFPTSGPFPIATLNTQLAKLFAIQQQTETSLGRAIRLADTDTTASLELPAAATRASQVLGFDANGTAILMQALDVGVLTVSSFIQTLLDDATAAAARTTLGAISVSDQNTFTARQAWSKGADIASASPLVVGADGNYFDVTGTTGFSAITVGAGTLFMLQFDGALAITHGSGITLPGAANITTVAGDRLIGFATAANTVDVISYTRASGAPLAPAASSVQLLGTFTAAAEATLDITGVFTATYPMYKIFVRNVVTSSDDTDLYLRASVSSTFQSGASDYGWLITSSRDNGSDLGTAGNRADTNAAQMVLNDTLPVGLGTGTNEKADVEITVWSPAAGNTVLFDWNLVMRNSDAANLNNSWGTGHYKGGTGAVDGLQLLMSTGNITGTAKVYGYP